MPDFIKNVRKNEDKGNFKGKKNPNSMLFQIDISGEKHLPSVAHGCSIVTS